jgi:membrane protein YdbS with pleckstrin-like domain
LKMLAISILINVVLYAVIGFLVWWGLNKNRWVLYAVGAAIVYGWYMILTKFSRY